MANLVQVENAFMVTFGEHGKQVAQQACVSLEKLSQLLRELVGKNVQVLSINPICVFFDEEDRKERVH